MPIILALLVLYFPRLLLAYLAIFTHWFDAARLSLLWLLLGFFFAPFSLLWYSAVHGWFGGSWGLVEKVVMAIAVVVDLSGGFGAMRKRK